MPVSGEEAAEQELGGVKGCPEGGLEESVGTISKEWGIAAVSFTFVPSFTPLLESAMCRPRGNNTSRDRNDCQRICRVSPCSEEDSVNSIWRVREGVRRGWPWNWVFLAG